MATESSSPPSGYMDSPSEEPPAPKPTRPIIYWFFLSTSIIGGAMISVLMIMAAVVAVGANENGYALFFGLMAGACIALPPLVVGFVMEKMWRLECGYNADD